MILAAILQNKFNLNKMKKRRIFKSKKKIKTKKKANIVNVGFLEHAYCPDCGADKGAGAIGSGTRYIYCDCTDKES